MRASTKSVCLLCRLEATSKTRAAPWPWQTQTARLSTTSSSRYAAAAHGASSEDAFLPASTSSGSQSPPYVRSVASRARRPRSNVEISQTKVAGKQPSARVDALFRQIVQEQQSRQGVVRRVSHPADAEPDLSLVKAIEALQEMMGGDTSIGDAYLFFRKEIYPAVRVPGAHVPPAYHKAKFALLEKVAAAKRADMFTESLPTVSEIFRTYAEAGELKPKQWAGLVGELVQSIIAVNPEVETQSIAKYERLLVLREAMLADLVESWKVLTLPRLDIHPASEGQLMKDFWFPRLDRVSLSRHAKKGDFSAAFSTLFPQYPKNQLGARVAMLAIATYALMHDRKRCSVGVRKTAAKFMAKVSYLITLVNYHNQDLQRQLVNTFPGLAEYVTGLWPAIRIYLQQKGTSGNGDTIDTYSLRMSKGEIQKTLAFDATSIAHRLARTHGTRNSTELEELWEEFVGPEETISGERAAQIRQHPALIDFFIKTRAVFGQPEKAIAAWNVLGKVGLKPSLRTWNLMLDGLKNAKNIDGIKNIWTKLSKSGLQLDTAIWTTRIGGLIDCGDIEGGLNALEEMVELWVNDTTKTAVKPTIEPVNAALHGLIRHRRHDVAEKLLAWAGSNGIQPDIFTFNTMLRSKIRNGNRDEDIKELLATMKAQEVRPDEATFVILLDVSFSQDHIRDPEEQATVVADIASAITSAGLELNMQAYGKMIYSLIRSDATAAAMALVNHMYSRNLKLSRHIYTMLIEHCFDKDPPALDSVHLFVEHQRRLDFKNMDRIFFDRVIGGYALHGETLAALDVYKHAARAGVRMSLSALHELLRALIREEKFADARDMVNSEKKRFEGRTQDLEDQSQYWLHQFWELAARHNLLDSQLPPH
ncbi:hypothetical protein F5Y14DRAFT_409001 [Nemania sp. NC0429]|nr:hypothetical protein F5Y14DRAFT_409001 [Nemania sp. NC0429]